MFRTLATLTTAAALLAIPLTGCESGGSGGAPEDKTTCDYDGKQYDAGVNFDSTDGCNTCSCAANGGVACTTMACATTCEYEGASYQAGDTFDAADGCNTCTCEPDGSVACTEMGCAPTCEMGGEVYNDGETWDVDCNTCTCNAGNADCTLAECFDCEYEGEQYSAGDTFGAGDGCNDCTCEEGGSVACTEMACAPTGCAYYGTTYAEGDTFDSIDGCNTCECTGATASCTEIACACDADNEWYRDYVGSSVEECALIDFGCPDNTTYFSNQCGCGCEQSSECPQFFNCMPPSDCDEEAIEKQCPYSEIAV